MSVFLIDYENVYTRGFVPGIDLLTPQDSLYIYYSTACGKLRKEYYEALEESGCTFKVVKLLTPRKNALDTYISVTVGQLMEKEREIAIISRDSGFESVKDYIKVVNAKDIQLVRADNIEQAFALFNSAENKNRRQLVAERLKTVSLDEVSARLKERERIIDKVMDALADTPYRFRAKQVCELFDNKDTGKKKIYTSTIHNFGRAEGLEIYNIIKEKNVI